MTEPLLYPMAAPPPVAFALGHLMPLGEQPFDPENPDLGPKRWVAGMRTPYRMVSLVPGPSDLITSYCRVRVHTFAETYSTASREADRSHRRMMLLVEDPLIEVALPGGGIANCESMNVTETPHEEPYASSSVITRFVSEYGLALRLARTA